jgi:hypothetical protein
MGRSQLRTAAPLTRSLFLVPLLLAAVPSPAATQDRLVFPDANSRPTSFSVHNLHRARELAYGAGVKVGILDHSFGLDAHPELYAGGENFQTGMWGETYREQSHHGYWMALALHEVAPAAEIYALNTYSGDEKERVAAMVQAIDWAIAEQLDVLTYSARGFSPEARAILDPAVERAHAAGIITTFIHYDHPGNIFPTWLGPERGDGGGREADLNLFHYDYRVVFIDEYRAHAAGDTAAARGYVPFLSLSSTSPLTAGMVALMRSLDPSLTAEDCRRILVETSRPMEFEGRYAPRVPDAYAALLRLRERQGETI